MGFFRKLFGGDDEATAAASEGEPAVETTPEAPASDVPQSALADPYRGAVLVEVDEHVEITSDATPIWHWRSRVMCIELGRMGQRLPLRSMVYTGKRVSTDVVRRITFGEGGYRLDWEHASFEDAIEGWIVRVEDRILVPRLEGLVAVHIVTGELCWELPHPAMLAEKPVLAGDGIMLLFADQRWMCVSPRDGKTLREGVVKNDHEASELRAHCIYLDRGCESTVEYGGTRVSPSRGTLDVDDGYRSAKEGPTAPSSGKYPLDDGWEPEGWMTLAGGKLAVRLERKFGSRKSAAVALFDPTSLEPLQLLELGDEDGGGNAWVVDDLIVVDLDLKEGGGESDVMFVIDPQAERVIAFFEEDGKDAYLFDRDGARLWEWPV